MTDLNPVTPEKFYGCGIVKINSAEKNRSKCIPTDDTLRIIESRRMPPHILGPNTFWREFNKQADALIVAAERSSRSDQLCTFVYQREEGCRKFVVAHPEVYWWYYKSRKPEDRNTYEVIPEGAPCWLYLDLEYQIELNPQNNGPRMTNTLIDILCAYLLKHWGFPCNKINIVNLDSTSDEKFSRHLIFSMKDVAFKDNSHVGRLVKSVCTDIVNYLSTDGGKHEILSYFKKSDIEQLLVVTKNGKKLFIDTGVYTKNRHFRIYLSTKWGKRSYLTMSSDSKHVPLRNYRDKELAVFLDSLISYFPKKEDLLIFEFPDTCVANATTFNHTLKHACTYKYVKHENISPYPYVDKYIQDMVNPGYIRAYTYFENTKTLIYEICGNRYCENIGRWHKSNNIFWVVDLKMKLVYQKCHDEDCIGFKSVPKKLPDEICFHFDDECDDVLSSCAIITEQIAEEAELFCDDSYQ